MTFFRTTAFRTTALAGLCMATSVAWLGPASADEDAMHAHNFQAAAHHEYAMYDLVDELSLCAGYYSIIEPELEGGEKSSDARALKSAFLLLGADALTTISPGSRSDRLGEMDARLDVSRRDFFNTFGSPGGLLAADTGEMEAACDALLRSKRKPFGWSVQND